MKYIRWSLVFLLITQLFPVLSVGAEEPADPGKVQPIFDGKFKCTDGYDPDTDASLHPAGQDPRSRQLINAQAQEDHEKQIAEKKDGAGQASTPKAGETKPDTKAVEGDKSVAEKKDPEKKDPEKKGSEKKDPDKKETGAKESDKKESDKKESKEAASSDKEKPKDGDAALNAEKANNPLNRAVFAIQSKNYQHGMEILKGLLIANAKNAQAHYLLAVSLVGLRRYAEAVEHYNIVLKLAPGDPKLSQLASDGLKRISGSK